MTRESDEACLALIATIRDRAQRLVIDGTHAQMYGTHSETERLLDNLEARISQMSREIGFTLHAGCRRMVDEMRIDREVCQAENARLRVQLADLGTEFVTLTGEVERLNAVCVIKDEEIASLRSEMREAAASAQGAIRFRDVIREEVAAEVGRQLEQRVGVAEAVWTWINNVQHELDKLRTALEAKAS
jgi:hypothetical protein